MKITFNVTTYLQEILRGKASTKEETMNEEKGKKKTTGEDLGLSYGITILKTRMESMEGES